MRTPMLGGPGTAARLAVAITISLALAGPALAQPMRMGTGAGITPSQMWTFLFLMLGPIKIVGPFGQMTRDVEAADRRRLAVRAIVFAIATLAIATAFGASVLENFNMQPQVLAVSGGLVLFLVALQSVLAQFGYMHAGEQGAPQPFSMRLASNPLAYPIIVTPQGIAAVIVFATLAPNLEARLMIYGQLAAIMALDLLAMLFARVILRWLSTPLQVLGTVLSIVQVALGLQIIISGLRSLGVIGLSPG